MKRTPVVDPDQPMTQEMRDALNLFETLCRVRGIRRVSVDEVVRHLMDEGLDHLAMAFNPAMLCAPPDGPQ